MASSSSPIIQLTTNNHFPIKLTTTNFPVWRKQVQSTLIGLDLEKFITGEIPAPQKTITDKEKKITNPEYVYWYRQDQIIIAAILGSCSEAIQPMLSSAETSSEAWKRLTTSYANSSRSRIISLKTKLTKNPKGSRPISEFLQEMRAIADELALVQSPVDEEDLMVHILAQLGEEYNPITAAIKVRETPISYSEMFDKLVDFERCLKESETVTPTITTVNATQKQQNRTNFKNPNENFNNNQRLGRVTSNQRNNRNQWQNYNNQSGGYRNHRNNSYCQYCLISGHDTKECRKLARFLKENNIPTLQQPMANSTTPRSNANPQACMFDSGASHHTTTDKSNLHPLSEYGGPDEILLGDGSTHGGANNAGGEHP